MFTLVQYYIVIGILHEPAEPNNHILVIAIPFPKQKALRVLYAAHLRWF